MLKGEIWWAVLPKAHGSEPAKIRPVLIVQSDSMNRSSVSTVMCVSITSNLELEHAPGNFRAELRLRKAALNPVELKRALDEARDRLLKLSVIESSIPSSKVS